MFENETYCMTIDLDESDQNQRLDHVLVKYCPDISRSKLQQWIKEGCVQVDDRVIIKMGQKLQACRNIHIHAELESVNEWQAEEIPLHIVFEDEEVLVVNKPAGLVVHPAVGNYSGTLVNALLHHDASLQQLPRAGIVHRLDKDTTGLLVVAKTLMAHKSLVEQLQARAFDRHYLCIVHGQMVSGGTVDANIGRHPKHRTHMAVVHHGKPAITHYRIEQKFKAFTHLKVTLETGRTHQIRVHMAHCRFPIVGDTVYGKKGYIPPQLSDELKHELAQFQRQALHATQLGFLHPTTGKPVSWSVEPPEDYMTLLEMIQSEQSL